MKVFCLYCFNDSVPAATVMAKRRLAALVSLVAHAQLAPNYHPSSPNRMPHLSSSIS
jgi:hypothetical protein